MQWLEDISQSVAPLPIGQIAEEALIQPEELVPYGSDKAKVKLELLSRLKGGDLFICCT